MGVIVSPVRNPSRSGVPISASPVVTASGRATSTKAAMPAMRTHARQSSPTSICMPMATKNTALNTSRIPSKVRSTWCRCGVSATIVPRRNAPSASE